MTLFALSVWDYLLFGLLMTASIGIGIFYAFHNRNRENTDEYFFAGRSMTCFPVAISLIVSFQSSILMLGVPAESYAYGIQYFVGEVGEILTNLLEILILLSFFKRLQLSSPYQYLEGRFQSRVLRVTVSAVKSFSYMLYMSVVLYGQGIAIQAVTGFSMIGSILVTAAAAIIYTSIGGLRAVIWTDVLQCTVMVTGILAVTIKGLIDVGSVKEVFSRAQEGGRFNVDLRTDPTIRHTVWNLLGGRFFIGLGMLFNPAVLQRVTATKSVTQARRTLFTTMLWSPIIVGLAIVEGIVAYGYYDHKGCDPVKSKQVDNLNQIIPFMMLDVFRYQPGLPGLFLAALFSATLSTLSSGYSALSNVLLEDLIKPWKPRLTEFKELVIAKSAVVLYGCISCGTALAVSSIGARTLIQIIRSLTSISSGPVTAVFYLGIFFPFVNTKSAIAGLLTGVSFLSWLIIGSNVSRGKRQPTYLPPAAMGSCPLLNATISSNVTMTPILESADDRSHLNKFYSLSYILYTCFGFLLALMVAIILSLITGGNTETVDPEYVHPVADKLCKYLPHSLKKYYKKGRNESQNNHVHVPMLPVNGHETVIT